jgi:hypothetical protein
MSTNWQAGRRRIHDTGGKDSLNELESRESKASRSLPFELDLELEAIENVRDRGAQALLLLQGSNDFFSEKSLLVEKWSERVMGRKGVETLPAKGKSAVVGQR